MSTPFERRNVDLLIEFDYYMAEHPDMLDLIPNKSWLIVTIEGDDRFNKNSIAMLRNIKSKKVVEAHKTGKTWSLRPLQLQQPA